MRLARITGWLDRKLGPDGFDDVSNNGLQIAREGTSVTRVAFGVDASVAFLERAAAVGAQLCVVHHGISWYGGVRRLTGPVYEVVKTAVEHDLALYASHLPLDANKGCGNNWEIARYLGLKKVRPAFSYHGNVIGVIGVAARKTEKVLGTRTIGLDKGQTVGICSGGAGEFAVEAKELGCDRFITGEANWADVIAARNVGADLTCCGHYETETFGVRALAKEMSRALPVQAVFLDV